MRINPKVGRVYQALQPIFSPNGITVEVGEKFIVRKVTNAGIIYIAKANGVVEGEPLFDFEFLTGRIREIND
jgi:hypothetical protein